MIQRQFVKVIFPFLYNQTAENKLETITVTSKKGKEKQLFKKVGFDNLELRKGLADLFSTEKNKSKIVNCYQVEHNSRSEFGLPNRQDEFMDFFCRGSEETAPFKVAITEVKIYLFESGVGFVEAEFNCQCTKTADLISCNYFLSERKTEDNYFVLTLKTGKEEYETVNFTLKKLLGNVLEHVSGVTDFYTGGDWETSVEKGIIYSYVYLDEKPANFDEILFNLRTNFKGSYKFPQDAMTLRENPFVLQQFDNSYWAASYNGAVNVSIQTDDNLTNNFFINDFVQKLHNEYYVLFLAVLHQRFVIMKLMWEMGELDRLDSDYAGMMMQLEEARRYQKVTADLRFRDFFKLPSYIQHVNDYYDLLYRTFCIDELYKDFMQDLNNVEQICSMYVDKIQKHEEQKKRRKAAWVECIVSFIAAMMSAVPLLNDAWAVQDRICGTTGAEFMWPVIVVTVFWGITFIGAIINAVRRGKEGRDIGKELKKEKSGSIDK